MNKWIDMPYFLMGILNILRVNCFKFPKPLIPMELGLDKTILQHSCKRKVKEQSKQILKSKLWDGGICSAIEYAKCIHILN